MLDINESNFRDFIKYEIQVEAKEILRRELDIKELTFVKDILLKEFYFSIKKPLL